MHRAYLPIFILFISTGLAGAAAGEECPVPMRKSAGFEGEAPYSKRYYDECQKLLGEYLNKLIKRAGELSSAATERAKLKPLPPFEWKSGHGADPIVKAVRDATEQIEKTRTEESESLKRLAAFSRSLQQEMKDKKGAWVEQISRPAEP